MSEQSAEIFRLEGNELVKKQEFQKAIELYGKAIILSPKDSILWGNRSLCNLSLGKYVEAENDARQSIRCDIFYLKGYFRLASVLKAKGLYEDAIETCREGLKYDSSNIGLKELLFQCIGLRKSSISPNTGLYHRSNFAVQKENLQCHPNEDCSCPPIPKRRTKGKLSTKKNIVADSKYCVEIKKSNPTDEFVNINNISQLTENEILFEKEIKNLLYEIRSNTFRRSSMPNQVLPGLFRQMLDENLFQSIFFVGADNLTKSSLPKNLNQLFEYEFINRTMKNNIPKMTTRCVSIFERILKRDVNNEMDIDSRQGIIRELVQETLATELVQVMKLMVDQSNAIYAKLTVEIATRYSSTNNATSDDKNLMDQLDEGAVQQLLSPRGYLVQDEFLGSDWSSLAYREAQRYFRDSNMSILSLSGGNAGSPLSLPLNSNNDHNSHRSNTTPASSSVPPNCEMSKVDLVALQQYYPCLAEVVRSLHALPYEINHATPSADCLASPQLLKAVESSTLLVYMSPQSWHSPKADNRLGGDADTCIRYSCAYHMVPPPLRSSLSESESESSSGSAADTAGTTSPSIPLFELRPVSLPTPLVSRDNSSHRDGEAEAAAAAIEEVESHEGQAERKTHRLEVIDDRLIIYNSTTLLSSRLPSSQEYFVLYFYIYGTSAA